MMYLRQWIRAIRWVMYAPLRRWRYLKRRDFPLTIGSLHHSVELNAEGVLDIAPTSSVGPRSVLNIACTGALVLKPGVWVGNDCEFDAGHITVGAHTSLQHRSIILGDVTIGAGCAMAPNLYISSGWHHFDDVPQLPIRWQDAASASRRAQDSRPVVIGDDCWLGINVVVMRGVVIGRGCVVGANSVVTKDLPPYSVAVGAPAKVVRSRQEFSPPSRLSAGRLDDIPYFYSGFDQWSNNGYNMDAALVRGGWRVQKQFTVALAVPQDAPIRLHVTATAAGVIRHGTQEAGVNAGDGVLQLLAAPSRPDYLDFEWLLTDEARGGELVLREVRQDK